MESYPSLPSFLNSFQGRIQDFKLGEAHLKKLRRAEGGAKILGVFRVNNHDFTPKNHIFSNCGGRYENVWGISCEKSRFYAQKSYFFQLRREARTFLGYFVWKSRFYAPGFYIIWNRHGHECSRIWKLSGNFTLIQCIKKCRDFLGTTFY